MLFIVLPAFNEAKVIGILLDKIDAAFGSMTPPPKVIVVDDGSSDGTADIVRAHPLAARGIAEVVAHPRNLGLGSAVRTALDTFMARSSGDDVLVTLDADDTHDPEVIKKLLDEIGRGAQVVTASRFQPGGKEVGVSFVRRVFSRGARVFMSLVAPVPGAKDYTCGFRAYSRPALVRAREIFGDGLVESDHFSCMSELLVKMAATGARISEVPFVLRYDRKQGPSKIKFSATLLGYVSLISMSRSARRKVRLHDKGGV